MKRRLFGFLGLLLIAVPLPAVAAGTRMMLVARDLDDNPLSGFRFAYQGLDLRLERTEDVLTGLAAAREGACVTSFAIIGS